MWGWREAGFKHKGVKGKCKGVGLLQMRREVGMERADLLSLVGVL